MKRNLKSLCAIVSFFGFMTLTSCRKDDIVGHFTVKGYLINSTSVTPIVGKRCRVDYSQHHLTTIKPAIEVGSGITDSSGYFEFSVELRRGGHIGFTQDYLTYIPNIELFIRTGL